MEIKVKATIWAADDEGRVEALRIERQTPTRIYVNTEDADLAVAARIKGNRKQGMYIIDGVRSAVDTKRMAYKSWGVFETVELAIEFAQWKLEQEKEASAERFKDASRALDDFNGRLLSGELRRELGL